MNIVNTGIETCPEKYELLRKIDPSYIQLYENTRNMIHILLYRNMTEKRLDGAIIERRWNELTKDNQTSKWYKSFEKCYIHAKEHIQNIKNVNIIVNPFSYVLNKSNIKYHINGYLDVIYENYDKIKTVLSYQINVGNYYNRNHVLNIIPGIYSNIMKNDFNINMCHVNIIWLNENEETKIYVKDNMDSLIFKSHNDITKKEQCKECSLRGKCNEKKI